MGYKKVCLGCKKAFNISQHEGEINLTCPECKKQTIIFNHKFRPPNQSDNKKWKLVEYLCQHGFVYQHVFKKDQNGVSVEVKYPETIDEAKEFVKDYKSQANTDLNIY